MKTSDKPSAETQAPCRVTLPSSPLLTGIGSLPHPHYPTALEWSFQLSLPFLPQIPRRSPWEGMIPQALEGFPGLMLTGTKKVTLNWTHWQQQAETLSEQLKIAFDSCGTSAGDFGLKTHPESLQAFEPTPQSMSCWHPFLWELGERGHALAKIQILGPLTAPWALSLENAPRQAPLVELHTQVHQFLLARALAMTHAFLRRGITPLIFLDEPGLLVVNFKDSKGALALSELKLFIQTLQAHGAIVGLHCCGQADWDSILKLPLDVLSLDTSQCLPQALQCSGAQAFSHFLKNGGRLALGIIPTTAEAGLEVIRGKKLASSLLHLLEASFDASVLAQIRTQSLLTPACGLATRSLAEADWVFRQLKEAHANFSL
ncbi:MAG: hypothetical protein ACO3A2_06325 [Bdellovibrionia bacterium]